jgi:hypothetical protein
LAKPYLRSDEVAARLTSHVFGVGSLLASVISVHFSGRETLNSFLSKSCSQEVVCSASGAPPQEARNNVVINIAIVFFISIYLKNYYKNGKNKIRQKSKIQTFTIKDLLASEGNVFCK